MIARIEFKGIVMRGTKKLVMRDSVDVHVAELKDAGPLLKKWCDRSGAIKGNSGVFHPLGKDGSLVVISIEEAPAE